MIPRNQRKELVARTWHRAWNHGDLAAFDELLSDDYVRYGNAIGQVQRLDDIKATITACRTAIPDLVTTIDDFAEEGDKMALRWSSTGTHRGPFMGVPPTGRRVHVSGVVFCRFRGGRIAEEWATWNSGQLLTELGIITIGSVA